MYTRYSYLNSTFIWGIQLTATAALTKVCMPQIDCRIKWYNLATLEALILNFFEQIHQFKIQSKIKPPVNIADIEPIKSCCYTASNTCVKIHTSLRWKGALSQCTLFDTEFFFL